MHVFFFNFFFLLFYGVLRLRGMVESLEGWRGVGERYWIWFVQLFHLGIRL